ncbi:MAG: radical SAM protein [Candidatus Paceibacterota bacterium]
MNIKQIIRSGITKKYLLETRDGYVVETSYIDRPSKQIICISTQVGCPLKCTFCISGMRKFKRSLTADEMIAEFITVFDKENKSGNKKPFLLSFMGEGEPFLNFEACLLTMRACWRYMRNKKETISFVISTSGIKTELLEKLGDAAKTMPIKLQVSFHSPLDTIRKMIVPVSDTLEKILFAVNNYQHISQSAVDWNYVLCKNINDDVEIAKLIPKVLPFGSHVKFNQLNPSDGNPHTRIDKETVLLFQSIVEAGGCTSEYYETDGTDIYAACGQLSYSYEKIKV